MTAQKKESNIKIDRLLSILLLLLRKKRVQAKELAKKFEVSTRTILRDIDALNLAGIPIITYQGINGGIEIAEGYKLDSNVLSSEEMLAMITSLKSMANIIPESQNEILLEKLKSILSKVQLEKLEEKSKEMIIDPSSWFGFKNISETFLKLKNAIGKKQKIAFSYLDSEGRETKRECEPYFLIMKGQAWYLFAFCLLRKDFRFFKLSRISDFLVTNSIFKARPIPEEKRIAEQNWESNVKMIKLELAFEKNMKTLVNEWFYDCPLKETNERFFVQKNFPDEKWLIGFILGLGTGVEVIKPLSLRKKIAKEAMEIAKKYSS